MSDLTSAVLTPVAIAARLAPSLVDRLEQHKPELIASAGGWVARHALATAWPTLVGFVPTVIETVSEAVLDEFGSMTVQQIAQALFSIKQAKAMRATSDHL